MSEQQLAILHDHYKETFARILAMEQSRNRLFLAVIGLFTLLALEIGYPAATHGALGSVSLLSLTLDLTRLPLPVLLDGTWVLTLYIVLRYCQTAIWIDRQYPYLHQLEEVIASQLRDLEVAQVYRREGQVYLENYPVLLDVAWFAYVYFFPGIILITTGSYSYWEYTRLSYAWFHLLFDSLLATSLVVVLFLYRFQPYIAQWRAKNRRASDPEVIATDGQPEGVNPIRGK